MDTVRVGAPLRARGRGFGRGRGRRERGNRYNRNQEEEGDGTGRRDNNYRSRPRPRQPGRGRGRRRGEDAETVNSDDRQDRPRGGRRGRGGRAELQRGRGAGRRAGTATMTRTNIDELAALESEMLVTRIDSQLKEFQQAIGDHKIVGRQEVMDTVVQILTKVANIAGNKGDAEDQSTASKIIAEILSERSNLFHFHLRRAVNMCTNCMQMEPFCGLFIAMLTTFPSLAWECLPIDELHETAKRVTRGGTINSEVFKISSQLCQVRDHCREADSSSKPNVSASLDDERDDSSFRLIPLLPEWKEICRDNGIPPEIRPNKVEKGYKDWIQYYDIQFRLIREDFIAPLRRGVTAFLHGGRGRKNRDVKTYSGAKIMSQVTTKDKGICFNVKFDATGFRKVRYNWDHSKRLIFGSLLCFIPTVKTSEDDIIFATVTDRNSSDLMGGKFMVQFEGDILSAMTHCSRQTEFEIVESNSYFEATRPILRSIQKAEVETMPFTRQLIEGKCDAVEPPAYLCAKEVPQVYDLSCLHGPLKKRRNKPPLKIEVLNKADWDKASDIELDTSQLHAIQTALTQGIAVIQGPPGTGKTYIGLKIVESLLTNRSVWDPRRSCPILVMCYTNHALDQFLEGIIDTECCGRTLEVIRVGGRCKNEKVEEYNLNKVRRRAPRRHQEISREIYKLRKELEEWNPAEIWHKLNCYHHRKTLLPMNILRHLAHPDHVYQLTQMAKCAEHNGKELEVWLNLWKCEIKGKDNENPPPQDLSKEKVEQGDQQKETQEQEEAKQKQTQEQEDTKQEEMEESGSRNDDEKIELEGEATIAQDERMDDDDVQGYQPAQLPKHNSSEVEGASIVPHYTGNSSEDEADEDADGNKVKQVRIKTIWSQRSNAHILIKRNIFRNPMDDEEAAELENIDISSLSVKDRWRLYNYWAEKRFQYLQRLNREHVNEYIEKCRQLAELRQREDRYVLESADVIGMTTTGAAKYQHILHTIKPKIVIVEEAAEVLEAHVVSALNAGTQHLILIGDHKQLRPKPNEYVLATQYNLSISLFERLIRNKLPCATLEIQHRMRPEIARLVCPHVYDKLLNHESVEKYPSVQGISKNLFFINHTEPENEDQNLMSYQNDFEAKYIVSMCVHLLKLGYSPSQITILTPYVGQLLKLRDKMPRKQFEGVRVTAIDNFQGEENDIILFSMVRSTNPRSNKMTIGFLKEDNRVCVSLSRAKHGFYAIGNFQLIRQQSVLWESIISDVEQRGCFGDALPLYCCNHPETTYVAKKESDFSANAPNGGCKKECDIRLLCGHSCTQKCHVVNREHIFEALPEEMPIQSSMQNKTSML